jgi:phosphohistidine phosphatase
MLKLVLLRHAKSSWRHEGIEDEFRPLNERGYADAIDLHSRFKKCGFKVKRILCSPAVRAYSTAIILARMSKLSIDTIQLEDDLYETSLKEHLKVLIRQPDKAKDLLVVGHNETLSYLATFLAKDTEISLSTSGFVVLQSTATAWMDIGKGSFELVADGSSGSQMLSKSKII